MIEKKVIVKIPSGMHIRPAGILAQEASKYKAKASIIYGYHTINVLSILNIVAGGIQCGDEILLRCHGEDEEQLMTKLIEVLEDENITA